MKQRRTLESKRILSLLLAMALLIPGFTAPAQAMHELPGETRVELAEPMPEIEGTGENAEVTAPEQTPDALPETAEPEAPLPETETAQPEPDAQAETEQPETLPETEGDTKPSETLPNPEGETEQPEAQPETEGETEPSVPQPETETPEAEEQIPQQNPPRVPQQNPDRFPGISEVDGQPQEIEPVVETPAVPSEQVTSPVPLPEDASKIVRIASAEDMQKIDPADESAYYVLDADITLDNKYNSLAAFHGTFDGRGHSVTFGRKTACYLFKTIEPGAVIQNVRFQGTVPSTYPRGGEYGPCGNAVKGSVINCISEVEGGSASGFTLKLDGGVISNCISIGDVGDTAIANQYTAGTVQNTYWKDTLKNSAAIPAGAMVNSSAKRESELKGADFIEALNRNKGDNGVEWISGDAGYPVLKAETLDVSDGVTEPTVYFLHDDGRKLEMDEKDTFQLSALDAGKFVLEGTDKNITWDCVSDIGYVNKHYWISGSSGRYMPRMVEKVEATVSNADDPSEIFKTFYIDNVSSKVEEIKVFVGDREISEDDPYTDTQGSEQVTINVKGKVNGKWVPIPASTALEYDKVEGQGIISAAGRFQIYNNSEAVFEVKFLENGLKARFKATANHVPLEKFEITAPSVWDIHEWNGLGGYYLGVMQGDKPARDFQITYTPKNAGNKKLNWKALTPEVAEYMEAFHNGIVPKKAGTAKFEVSSAENPEIKQELTIEFRYKLPLESAKPEKDVFEFEAGRSKDIKIETYPQHASEQRFRWTYDKEGIVTVGDTVNIDPANVSTPKWTTHTVNALKPGIVTVTGTPYDNTKNCAPVQFTVKVTGDGAAPQETESLTLAKDDIAHGVSELKKQSQEAYRDEWGIFTLLRAGERIPQNKLDRYYASVEDKIKNSSKLRATDFARVAITLEAMGKDPTNVGGINLLEKIYNCDTIGTDTSNCAIWSLIALDGVKSEIPANALWTREKLIGKILSFQTEQGGFGLADNRSSSIDMTGMALQALAPYYKDAKYPTVKSAVDRTLDYLKQAMTPNAGYLDGGAENSCTTAQVLTALAALEIDPVKEENGFTRGRKNLITNLHGYKADAGFGWQDAKESNGMATQQVTYALVAYQRLAKGMTGLYDMTDVNATKPPVAPETPEAVVRVMDLIDDIGRVTLDSRREIERARAAYDQLPRDQKELVTNYNKLVAAEKKIKELEEAPPEKTTVSLSVDLKTIGKGYIISPSKVAINKGDTVWDVLKAELDERGIDYEYENYSQYGSVYVQSMDGVGEFDHGSGSGWMYNVNGEYPKFGCSKYVLKGGERIQWRYTTNLGEDLGELPWDDSKEEKPSKNDKEQNTDAVVTPQAKPDQHGQAQVTVTEKELQDAIKQAEKKQSEMIIVAPKMKADATEVVVKLPKESLSQIADKMDAAVNVRTEIGSAVISNAALASIVKQSDSKNIEVMIKQKSAKDVSDKVQPELMKQAAVVEVTITADKDNIHTFGGNSLLLNLPANSSHHTEGETYEVVVISSDGTMETMPGKCVKTGGKLAVQVETPHLSTFVVTGQKLLPFDDVTGHWAQDAIQYVYSHGIMKGTETNLFSPDEPLSRAMLVSILYRKEGAPKVSTVSRFPDVQASDWYADAVIWAEEQGILSGTDGGKFAPDAYITREEMAVMLHRYARYKQYDVSRANALTGFRDADQVSFWAVAAMEWANTVGLMTGHTFTILDPQGTATRAEAAAVLMRFSTLFK